MTPATTGSPTPALDLEHGRVVVVGGGLAATRLCAVLRRKKFRGTITVLSAEEVAPYDRPPLSKAVLAGERDDAPLPFDTEKLDVDLRLGVRATALDTESRTVLTNAGSDDADAVAYDALAIATGAAPLRLPGDGPQATLRTLDDALALRERLVPGARVVIVGASWIGAEVATTAHAAGCQVTCVEFGAEPLSGALGDEIGAATRAWWEGIDLRTSTGVTSAEPDGVHLDDGTVVPADVVVTGIGVRPDLAWLAGSGLELDRGVLTDTRCRTNVPGVIALGDVAQRWSAHSGSHRLVEHWDEASMVATAAASSLVDWEQGPEHDPVPYFWSDQFGRKLQYVGAHAPDDALTIDKAEDGSLQRATWSRGGVLTAWLGVDVSKELVKARMAVGGPVAALD